MEDENVQYKYLENIKGNDGKPTKIIPEAFLIDENNARSNLENQAAGSLLGSTYTTHSTYAPTVGAYKIEMPNPVKYAFLYEPYLPEGVDMKNISHEELLGFISEENERQIIDDYRMFRILKAQQGKDKICSMFNGRKEKKIVGVLLAVLEETGDIDSKEIKDIAINAGVAEITVKKTKKKLKELIETI